ncbi:hypothetical protein HanRHA438_Chr13g0583261 [Helianthus annuus]|nr:hypothetical protein HanRHA438_Chr13g0583261 [Helianthus annuus]
MVCLNPVLKSILPSMVLLDSHKFRGFLHCSSFIFHVHVLSNVSRSSRGCSKRIVEFRIHVSATRFSKTHFSSEICSSSEIPS